MTALEINALATALAEILVKDLSDEDIRILAQFVLVLNNTIRSYLI